MKGKILDYSFFNNSGNLITDDGDQYEFSGNSWNEQPSPKTGDIVKVALSNTGMVDSISYLNASIPPSLSGGYSSTKTNSSSNTISEKEEIALNIKYIKEDDYNFFDWVLEAFGNFTNFKGRARRKEFWYFYLVSTIITIIASFVSGLAIVSLLLIIPALSSAVRRLHDVGRSGLWAFTLFIPIFIWSTILVLVTTLEIKTSGVRALIIGSVVLVWTTVFFIRGLKSDDTTDSIAKSIAISAIWMLMLVIPYISLPIVLYFMCKDTSPENNRWGAPARRMH